METNNEMRIYIADLACYNNGIMSGAWVGLPCDDMAAALAAVLEAGTAARVKAGVYDGVPSEEWAIHDYEGLDFYGSVSEWEDLDALNDAAIFYDDLSEDDAEKIEAIKAVHGTNYYKSLEDALNAANDSIGMIIDGVSNDYDLARKLEYELGYDDELFRILGCSPEAYEQLSSFIRTDDIAATIDQEFSFAYVNNTAYEIIG